MFKFIHAADIHLDSPLRGLERYEGAPVERIRGATRQALKNLVALAMDEGVAFVVIAGDLYDGDWRDYNTGLFFAAEMSKLREAGIGVYVVSGNHDAGSQISRQLRMPDNVRRLDSKHPETLFLDQLGVAIHGQGFFRPAVTVDLSVTYPDALPGLFNIGILHTSASGRDGHEPYAPCTVPGLVSKGYDYWALGHVHKREVLCEEPLILFPGNIQGRHIRESGSKGCSLVTVDTGRIVSLEHKELDVLRWCLKEIDATGKGSGDELVDVIGEAIKEEVEHHNGGLLAMRLHVLGACRAHDELISKTDRWLNDIRMTATDVSAGNVWLEKIKIQTKAQVNLEEMLKRDDPVGGLLRSIHRLSMDDEALDDLFGELHELKKRLPLELQQGDEAIDLTDRATRLEIIEDIKQILMGRLLANDR